ncbi:hypothetical protein LEJE111609_20375 [Lelliottia jeotgali]
MRSVHIPGSQRHCLAEGIQRLAIIRRYDAIYSRPRANQTRRVHSGTSLCYRLDRHLTGICLVAVLYAEGHLHHLTRYRVAVHILCRELQRHRGCTVRHDSALTRQSQFRSILIHRAGTQRHIFVKRLQRLAVIHRRHRPGSRLRAVQHRRVHSWLLFCCGVYRYRAPGVCLHTVLHLESHLLFLARHRITVRIFCREHQLHPGRVILPNSIVS